MTQPGPMRNNSGTPASTVRKFIAKLEDGSLALLSGSITGNLPEESPLRERELREEFLTWYEWMSLDLSPKGFPKSLLLAF